MTLLAPLIGNDVSYVTRIIHEIPFAWQAQYLVKLECDFSWQFRGRNTKCRNFSYKRRLEDGTSQVSEAAGAR